MRLQSRLAILFAVVVTAAALLMGALSYAAIAEALQSQTDESLSETATPLTRELHDGRIPGQLMGGRDGPRDHRDESGLLLPTQVLMPSGQIVVAQTNVVTLPVDKADLQIAGAAQALRRYQSIVIDGRSFRMLTAGVGDASGAIQIARDVTDNAEVLASLARVLIAIGLMVAALAAVAGWLLARRSAKRLVALTDSAETVTATGRLDATVPTTGTDEIARLGTAFNAMLLRLEQSNSDQQRLVQDAGHELRTPLTSLRTNVSLLRHFDSMPGPTRERVIADLEGETRELTTLVNEVLHHAASTPSDAAPQLVDLGMLAASVAARALRRTGRQIEVTADPSQVWGQPIALERAMWNLVENATKFTAAGSQISLSVDKGWVLLSDRGPGLDPGDVPHIFDRFYRSTSARSQPGSGLGLAIVADVATSHSGRVSASNREGGGAVIGFWVPTPHEGL